MTNREAHNDRGRESHHKGPGNRLRQAREELNLSLEEVARHLHLTTTLIHELEHNQFNKNTNLVFIRGYLRAYAAHLNLPPDEIVHEFDQLGLVEKVSDYRLELSYKPQRELFDRLVPWFTGGGIALVILAGFIGWHNYASVKQSQEVAKQSGVAGATIPSNLATTPTPPADALPANALTPTIQQTYRGLESKSLTANPVNPAPQATSPAARTKSVAPINAPQATPSVASKPVKPSPLNDILENRRKIITTPTTTPKVKAVDADIDTDEGVTSLSNDDSSLPVKQKKKISKAAKPQVKLDAPF